MGIEVNSDEMLLSNESSNRSTPWSEDFVFDNYTARLIIAIVMCLVSVIAIPGNCVVILAVMLSKRLQSKTNIFVVNLACADMLAGAVLPFQALSLLTEEWLLPKAICTMVAVLLCVGLGSSVLNLAFIAFIRCSIITKIPSFDDRLFTKCNQCLLVCGAWFLPLFLTLIPPTFGVGAVGYSERYKLCTVDTSHPMSDMYTLVSLFILLPSLFVIVLCYFKIYKFVKNAGRNLIQSGTRMAITQVPENTERAPLNATEMAIFRRQVKVTKNLFVVVCAFIICVMPYGLVSAIPATTQSLRPWVLLLFFTNSCLNPIIYGFKHPHFKEVCWQIVTCSWKNIPEPSSQLKSFINVFNQVRFLPECMRK